MKFNVHVAPVFHPEDRINPSSDLPGKACRNISPGKHAELTQYVSIKLRVNGQRHKFSSWRRSLHPSYTLYEAVDAAR